MRDSGEDQTGNGGGRMDETAEREEGRSKSFPQLRKIGTGLVYLLLHLALIDVAVETFVSDSPIRWWVVGVTLGYLALLVSFRFGMPALWARVPIGAKLTAGLLVLLGLVVAAVWMPGGFETGLRAGAQPTHRVYAALTAVALLLAMALLLTMRRLPVALRIGLVLLGSYGAAGFVLGWTEGTAYPVLFAGEAFWSAVPWWLQAPAVGALGVLPATLLLYGFDRIRSYLAHRKAGPGLAARTSAVFVLGAGVAIGVAGAESARDGLLAVRGGSTEQASFVPLTETPLSPEWEVERAALRSRVDREKVSIEALQARLGSDPQTLLAFVRDEIEFEPYEGALRGARGALLARAGNAVDRALLLRALLDAAGHETRLAEGRLSDAEREFLWRGGVVPGPHAQNVGPVIDVLFETAAYQLERIGDALWANEFRAPALDDVVRPALEAMARHVWVQARSDGDWVDLDPSPSVASGETLTSQRESHPDAPDEWHYTLGIRVVVDVERDGDVITEEVLAHSARYADLAGVPVGLFHEREPDRATAVLLVGDRVARSRPFPAPPVADEGLQAPVEEAIDLLGSLPTGEGEEATRETMDVHGSSEPPGELVRERLLIELGGPSIEGGETSFVVTLADREAAESEEHFGETLDMVVGIGGAGGPRAAELPAAILAEASNPLSPVGVVRMLAALEATRASLRARVPVSAFGLPTRRIVDGPQLTVLGVRSDEAAESVELRMDLARKSYRLVPVGALDRGNTLFFDYVFNGAADHAVERAVLPGGVHSVGALTDATAAQGIELAVARSSREIPDYLPSAAEPHIRDALDRDRLIVLPEARPSGVLPDAMGWWEVDAEVGWTEDRHADGGHQEQAEYGIITATRTSQAAKWRQYGCALAVVVGGVTGQVGEGMTAVGEPTGVILTTVGEGMEALGELGCRSGPRVSPAGFGGPARRTAGRGFPAIHRTLSRKPWVQGGRVFPGRGRP